MLILTNEEIEPLLAMPDAMAILREMYCDVADGATLTMPRTDNIAPSGHPEAYYGFKHMGGIWVRRQLLALRINSDTITHPMIGGSTRRVKVPRAGGRYVGLVQLFDTNTGALVAIFPDGVAQRTRVGATTGLGIECLARADATRAGIIGSGWQAGTQLSALLAARRIQDIKVYSTQRENREAFAKEARTRGVPIRPVDSAAECAQGVDILLASTSAMNPVIQPEWLRPGMHISCIKVQEVSRAVLERCDRVGVHNKAQAHVVTNVFPGATYPDHEHQGWWGEMQKEWSEFSALPDMISGRATGRTSDEQITCFINNIGLGLQFVAMGALIVEKARRMGIGRELPDDWFTESVHP